MKKLLIIFGLLTIISSCSSESDDIYLSNIFQLSDLESTGDLSEQSAEEAKKTIYGKWEFPSSSTGRSTCELVSLEFTNQNFFMTLDIGDRSTFAGRFTLGEDASGKVEKVELKYIFDDNSEIVIAVVTNLVVTKTGDDLNATFNIAFAFPINSEVEEGICNDGLSGNIEAKKAEPMAESKNSSADSNNTKIIGAWMFESLTDYEEGKTYSAKEWIEYEVCDSSDCTISKMIVEITPYGTWVNLQLNANGGIEGSYTGTWKWKDTSQEVFTDQDMDEYNILSISNLEMTLGSEEGSVTYKKV